MLTPLSLHSLPHSARFISEFGFQSLPSYETYSRVLSPEDYNRNSDVLNFRQRHDGGNAQIEFMVDKHFKLPPVTVADGNVTTQRQVFDDYLYLTQVRLQTVQGSHGMSGKRGRTEGGGCHGCAPALSQCCHVWPFILTALYVLLY